MAANYDNAAWFYDGLSGVVFGKALIKAQTHFLQFIPPNTKILIAGGGTGRIIEEIAKIHPAGLQITYAELSARMMARARKRNYAGNQVAYINLAVEEADLPADFDVIITPFLLDSLSPGTFDKVFDKLSGILIPGGFWINTDFQLTGKMWQRLLLKSMYLFFRMMGCVENIYLPLIKQRFGQAGFIAQQEKAFFGAFILTAVYQRKQYKCVHYEARSDLYTQR